MRTERKAGPALINIYQKEEGAEGGRCQPGMGRSQPRCQWGAVLLTNMAVLPTPAWGTLALVWSSADTSIKTRLGADGWVHLRRKS